jgi:uncharacterized membrane protein YkoI
MLWIAVIIALVAKSGGASEEKIKPQELPKKVMDSLHARFPELTITSAAKESDANGNVVFDVELKQKNRKYETDIKENGVMLEVEKEVTSKHWSKALRDTIDAKYPKAKITEVMEVNKVAGTEEVPDHLETTIETADKKTVEVLTSLDGKSVLKDEHSETASTAGEEKVKPQDLPQAVKVGVERKYPKAEITGAEKGEEDGQQIYEVSIKSENRNIDVTFNPKGEILSIEKTLLESERPAALIQSLNAKYPHATVKLIEEVWEKDKMTGYEATIVTADKKSMELDFDPHGKLIEDKK